MRKLAALATVVIAGCWTGLAAAGGDPEAVPVPAAPSAPAEAPIHLPAPATELPRGVSLSAEIARPALLRRRPMGRVLARLGRRTGFDTPQVLAVVARRPGWVAVLHHEAGNSRTGWLPEDAVRIYHEPNRILVDLSQRRATVRRRGRVVRRFEVAVGRPGHDTPTGRFAITDRLLSGQNLPYGCCILALTGRQPNLPADWPGGDRIAFHGVPDESRIDVGLATSTGCMHVRERDLQWMIRQLRAGARVDIRA